MTAKELEFLPIVLSLSAFLLLPPRFYFFFAICSRVFVGVRELLGVLMIRFKSVLNLKMVLGGLLAIFFDNEVHKWR